MSRLIEYVLPISVALGAPLVTLVPEQVGQPVFVVASPWSDVSSTLDLVGRADGLVLRATALSWIAIATSDRPDFPARLRRAGAWMILNAVGISGCKPPAD